MAVRTEKGVKMDLFQRIASGGSAVAIAPPTAGAAPADQQRVTLPGEVIAKLVSDVDGTSTGLMEVEDLGLPELRDFRVRIGGEMVRVQEVARTWKSRPPGCRADSALALFRPTGELAAPCWIPDLPRGRSCRRPAGGPGRS